MGIYLDFAAHAGPLLEISVNWSSITGFKPRKMRKMPNKSNQNHLDYDLVAETEPQMTGSAFMCPVLNKRAILFFDRSTLCHRKTFWT